jgi:hypothetical protein
LANFFPDELMNHGVIPAKAGIHSDDAVNDAQKGGFPLSWDAVIVSIQQVVRP